MENLETKENEPGVQTRVILEFMRHGEKDNNSSKWDKKKRLTEKGRKMAQEKGEELNPDLGVSLGWGSPRERTQETILHVMLPDIGTNATLEDMEKNISEEQKVGKKMVIDPRLDYTLGSSPDEESLEASKGNRGLKYIVEKSDSKALETEDKISSTYTRAAADIAEIISRYVKIGNNFNKIASNDPKKYSDLNNQLERYLGTSQGTTESFIARLLEITQGIEKRDEFLDLIGNGFGETKGIRVEISNNASGQIISVGYELDGKKEEIVIDENILNQMIEKCNEFNNKINERSKQNN